MARVRTNSSQPPTFAESIGRRIHARRKTLGWSLDVLAEKSGLSKTHIWQLENGQSIPGADSALKVAEALSLSVSWLIAGNGEPSVKPVGSGPEMIPASLAEFADRERIPFRTVLLLRNLHVILADANRKTAGTEKFDWQRFYEMIKGWL
jgi:transcriptional regulator with XRE-family HTH domain